jgi:hypothetical protein
MSRRAADATSFSAGVKITFNVSLTEPERWKRLPARQRRQLLSALRGTPRTDVDAGAVGEVRFVDLDGPREHGLAFCDGFPARTRPAGRR